MKKKIRNEILLTLEFGAATELQQSYECVCVYTYISMSVCLSVCMDFKYITIHMYVADVCLAVWLYMYLSIYTHLYLTI
jgi:hypothetical protein